MYIKNLNTKKKKKLKDKRYKIGTNVPKILSIIKYNPLIIHKIDIFNGIRVSSSNLYFIMYVIENI